MPKPDLTIHSGRGKPSDSPPRRTYECTVCGVVGFWDENWSYYGSFAHTETCLRDLPFACSGKCRGIVEENLKSGKWEIPKLRRGPGGGVDRERRGY